LNQEYRVRREVAVSLWERSKNGNASQTYIRFADTKGALSAMLLELPHLVGHAPRDVGFAANGVQVEVYILVPGPHGANDLLSIPSSVDPLIGTFGSNSSRFESAWSVKVSVP
jgi:hypothetical protein